MSSEPESKEVLESPLAEAAGATRRRRIPGFNTVQAIALGIGDTFKDMLHTGQAESQRAHNEAWHRYDELTKHRRELKRREKGED